MRWRRLSLWISGSLVGLLLATVLLLSSCLELVPSEKRLAEAFVGRERPRLELLTGGDRPIRFAEVGNPEAPPVVLVHGSPGSWADFLELLRDPSLTARTHLIVPDRPGFGGSGDGDPETSLASQARLLAPLLERDAKGRPAILVGHSYGGPLIVRLAIDYPTRVAGLILVAGSVDPGLERTRWYQRLARWPPVRALLPRLLRVADDEIRPLEGELEAMLPRWREIHVPVTVIQGDDDALVPRGNADFAERMLVAAPLHMVRVHGMGHLIPWQRPVLIRDAILAHLDAARTEFTPPRVASAGLPPAAPPGQNQ